jgi:two-component system NtrC family response regulator
MKPKILVIDDEVNMLTLLKRVLGKEGYQVLGAESGKEGVRLAGTETFSLAIVDVRLPDMDGLNVLKRLKEINPRLPVILISAYPTWEVEEKAKKEGSAGYLTKPLNLKLLKDIVKKNLIEVK